MIRRPPRCTRTDPRFPYTTLFRSAGAVAAMEAQRLNDPLSNKKRAGEAGSSWGCRVGGSLKRSGAAEGREPAGRSPKRGRLRERSEEHTSELQSLMRISYAVFCLKKKNTLKNKKLILKRMYI